MKKIVPVISALALLAPCFSVPVYASPDPELPFELTAPENVAVVWLEERDSPNTLRIAYSQNRSMSAFSVAAEVDYDAWRADLEAKGFDELWITPQIDWSIDSQDDWHCNEYWLTEGYDEDYVQHLNDWAYTSASYSPDLTMTEWIFRFGEGIDDPDNWGWNGRHVDSDDYDGWKDVLKEGQYDVVEQDGVKWAKIDFTKHTVYTRVRWLVTCRMPDETADAGWSEKKITSDWSEIAAVGKDATSAEKFDSAKLTAPVISDLRMTNEDFNGYPVVAFTLDVDPEITKMQTNLLSAETGGIDVYVEASVHDKNDWVELQGDWTLRSGEFHSKLQVFAEHEGKVEKGTPIDIRCRYVARIDDPLEGYKEYFSDYSDILTIESEEMIADRPDDTESEEPVTDGSAVSQTESASSSASSSVTAQEAESNSISPVVILLMIFLPLLLLVIIIIIIVVILSKKKKNNQNS